MVGEKLAHFRVAASDSLANRPAFRQTVVGTGPLLHSEGHFQDGLVFGFGEVFGKQRALAPSHVAKIVGSSVASKCSQPHLEWGSPPAPVAKRFSNRARSSNSVGRWITWDKGGVA